jgi:DNA-binding GntR family transcriptional regulator
MLDRSSPLPLYAQIAQVTEAAIRRNELLPGQLLESEVQMALNLGVSRPTVRAAMAYLVQQGLIVKARGAGNVVAPRPLARQLRTNVYDSLRATSRNPTTMVLSIDRVLCPPDVQQDYGIASDAELLRVERIRYADGLPIALMRNHLVVADFDFTPEDIVASGLYPLLKERGITVVAVSVRLEARAASAAEAETLSVAEGSPVLVELRDGVDGLGRLIDRGSHVFPGDRYAFEAMLAPDPTRI